MRTASAFDRLAAAEDTLVATLDRLREAGYESDFVLEPGDIPPGLWCRTCGRRHLPQRSEIVKVYRFEGPSSPEDEALLLVLVCPRCEAKGTAVTAYGPVATASEAELLMALAARATATIPSEFDRDAPAEDEARRPSRARAGGQAANGPRYSSAAPEGQ